MRFIGSFINYVKPEHKDRGEYVNRNGYTWDGGFFSDNAGFPESVGVARVCIENVNSTTITSAATCSVNMKTVGYAILKVKGVTNGFIDKNENIETLAEKRSRVAQRWIARSGRAQCADCASRNGSKVEEKGGSNNNRAEEVDYQVSRDECAEQPLLTPTALRQDAVASARVRRRWSIRLDISSQLASLRVEGECLGRCSTTARTVNRRIHGNRSATTLPALWLKTRSLGVIRETLCCARSQNDRAATHSTTTNLAW